MIRRFSHIFIIVVTLGLYGCCDFLERSAQNLVIPTTCADYKEILQGEGYFVDLMDECIWLNLMTDDMELYTPYHDNTLPYLQAKYRFAYQWRDDIELVDEGFSDMLFEHLYSQVLIANTCLEALDNGLEGTKEEQEILRGQALFHRAYAYLLLANVYAKPYDLATPETECVPLRLTPTPSLQPEYRATFAEVYGQIEEDIEEGLELLKGKKTGNFYYIGYDAMLFVAMRAALYTNQFEKVIEYGEEILEHKDALFDITDRVQSIAPGRENYSSDYDNFLQPSNPEIIFAYTGTSGGTELQTLINIGNTTGQTFTLSHNIENSLIGLYDYDTATCVGDHRLAYWYIPPRKNSQYLYYSEGGNYNALKANSMDYLYRKAAFRTAEAYISVAEAYARKDKPEFDTALDYANRLRKYRLDAQAYKALTPADFESNEDIIQFLWDERRRELCFEEMHRWIDLRRTTRAKIIHPYGNAGYYIMNKDDDAYTLNFPESERQINPHNVNPRPIRPINNY